MSELSKNIMIYNDFELIDKDTINLFVENIKEIEKFYLECTLNYGKIIIHYPDDFNGTKVVCCFNKDAQAMVDEIFKNTE